MMKKLIGIGLALMMIFALGACSNVSLADYKITKLTELQDYADAKGQRNYDTDGWTTICDVVTEGKAAVEEASIKPQVDTAVATTKAAINAIEREDANLEWKNENAVYAFVKAGFESDILQDIEGAFETLNFQKVYVAEKNVNTGTPLVLLFILDEVEFPTQQEFVDFLNQDARINYASKNRDVPFETVDTRHIDNAKDTIVVGETLTLELKGNIDYYYQKFGFEGLLVKPTTSKPYTVSDFPVDLKSVEARDNGWLCLKLATQGYFEVIKAADVLSRWSTIEKVELDRSLLDLPLPAPPTWELSDYTIAKFVAEVQWDDYPRAVIIGLKEGKVTVYFNDVICEITVVQK